MLRVLGARAAIALRPGLRASRLGLHTLKIVPGNRPAIIGGLPGSIATSYGKTTGMMALRASMATTTKKKATGTRKKKTATKKKKKVAKKPKKKAKKVVLNKDLPLSKRTRLPTPLEPPPEARKTTGYLLYADEFRHNASGTVIQIAHNTAAAWRNLSTSEKAEFNSRAAAENATRQENFDNFLESLSPEQIKEHNSIARERKKRGLKRHVTAWKDPRKPKRSLAAHILYLQDVMSGKTEGPSTYIDATSVKDRFTAVMAAYKDLPPDRKQHYQNIAAQDSERYHRELEEYKKL